jgi:hypothetical protein
MYEALGGGGKLVPVGHCNQTRAIVNDHLSTE